MMLSRYTGGFDSVKRRFLLTLAGVLGWGSTSRLLANPEGMTVASGSASVQQQGSSLNLTVSQGAVLNWQQFNIKPGETTAARADSKASLDASQTLASNDKDLKKDEEEWKKKSSSSPVLKRSAGRVTVILSQN